MTKLLNTSLLLTLAAGITLSIGYLMQSSGNGMATCMLEHTFETCYHIMNR